MYYKLPIFIILLFFLSSFYLLLLKRKILKGKNLKGNKKIMRRVKSVYKIDFEVKNVDNMFFFQKKNV